MGQPDKAFEWNYGDLFDAVEAVIPGENPALIHGDQVVTWGAFRHRTNSMAANWLSRGFEPGERVAFYLRNHPAYMEGVAAALKARLVHVNVNYRYVADEVRYILDNSDAAIVIFGRAFAPAVAAIAGNLPGVRLWLCVEDGSTADVPDFAIPYEALANGGDGAPLSLSRSPDDQIMLYTGGTTGLPKGVIWRHDAARKVLLNPALSPVIPADLEQHRAMVEATGRGPVCLPACPLMHGTGLFTALSAMIVGGTVVTLTSPHLDVDELWCAVRDRRVEQIIIVGDAFAKPMLRGLQGAAAGFDLSSLVAIISSGIMWSVEVKQALLGHLPKVALVDSFGSSEAMGFGMSIMTAAGEVGTARFQIGEQTRVFTTDGKAVEPGSGEIGLVARGEPIPSGYHKDPVKTAAVFKVIDGVRYAIPGDYCTVEADGTITLIGRGSGCINTAGEKVFPEEVEEVLKLHPDVEDVLVVGLPDEKWGQAVTAVIELADRGERTEDLYRGHVRAHLAAYKAPKRVVFVDRMFRAPNGKADYRLARDFAIEQLGRDAQV
ncbi:acyl-CoA synthetase [Zavarzinia aquatilis]|uniref:Acyl-CoA synthetase n=1 Tax=Zavarzinia aquatilis TaxID=2211142 RepID=A0A317EGA4_9PROT|nr:acyl-CoA synthetase [Zavarzinia aquatilis]PWR25326.1 acyl-CoA synthetase [Zavarzinia aquatilis]